MDHEYLDSAGEEELMDSGGEREDDKVNNCTAAVFYLLKTWLVHLFVRGIIYKKYWVMFNEIMFCVSASW